MGELEVAGRVQPRQAGWEAVSVDGVAVGLSAAPTKTASSACLMSGLWEGDPREHELGLSENQSPN